MQEKAVNLQKNTNRRYTTKEERQSHLDSWKKSALSMSEYCRQNNLALASLSEWKRSILRDNPKFKPIQPLSSLDAVTKPNNIIEIIVDQRIKIRLQHVSDAWLVINIAQGLMKCS